MTENLDSAINRLKEDLSAKMGKHIQTVESINSFDASSLDRSTHTETLEGVSADTVKGVLLEHVVMAEDPEEEQFFKSFFKTVKDKLPEWTQVNHLFKKRKLTGYSEYTCWQTTVESSGEIELIDLAALYSAIDEFSDSFKETNSGR